MAKKAVSKKKITAPKLYKPGKGKPVEHLAYLNEREMAYLRSLGGSGRPGPKGLPSFADDSASSKGVSRGGQGATGSGSTRTSNGSVSNRSSGGNTSGVGGGGGGGGGSTGSRGSSTGGVGSGNGSNGGNYGGSNSSGTGQRGAGSNYGAGSGRPGTSSVGTNATGGSGTGARNPTGGSLSAPARTAPSSNIGSNSGNRNPTGGSLSAPARTAPSSGVGGGGRPVNAAADAAFRQAAVNKDAIGAVKNNALRADLNAGGISTLNVGPMGTPVSVKGLPRGELTPMTPDRNWADSVIDAGSSIAGSISNAAVGALRYAGLGGMFGPSKFQDRLPQSGQMPSPDYSNSTFSPTVDTRRGVPTTKKFNDRVPQALTSGPSDGITLPANKLSPRGAIALDRQYEAYREAISRPEPFKTGDPRSAGGIPTTTAALTPASGSMDSISYYDRPRMAAGTYTKPYDKAVAQKPTASTVGTYAGGTFNPESELQREAINRGLFKSLGIMGVSPPPPDTPVRAFNKYDKLRAYDSPYGPELAAARGSQLESMLQDDELRRTPSGTYTTPYDRPEPVYSDRMGPVPPREYSRPYDMRVPPGSVPANGERILAVEDVPETNLGPMNFARPEFVGGNPSRNMRMENATLGGMGIMGIAADPTKVTTGQPALKNNLATARRNAVRGDMDYSNIYNEVLGDDRPRDASGRLISSDDSDTVPRDENGDPIGTETPAENSFNPSQEPASPSQDSEYTPEQQAAVEANNRRIKQAKIGLRVVSPFMPGANLVASGLGKLNKLTNALVEKYRNASIPERAQMEQKYPNLIRHANEMGINTGGGTMDDYRAWAEKSGLTGSGARDGGNDRSGVGIDPSVLAALNNANASPGGGSNGGGGSSGARPEIYFMWDVGVNIPSPGDSNYNLYLQYLAEKGMV